MYGFRLQPLPEPSTHTNPNISQIGICLTQV